MAAEKAEAAAVERDPAAAGGDDDASWGRLVVVLIVGAAALGLFLPALEADAAGEAAAADPTVGSVSHDALPPLVLAAVSACPCRVDDGTDDDASPPLPAPPPLPVSCSLLAYAASLDVRWRTWRRPPLPLIGLDGSSPPQSAAQQPCLPCKE